MDCSTEILDRLVSHKVGKYPRAKLLAVENFVFSAPEDKLANAVNLNNDARSYCWNSHTVLAIRECLEETNRI